jgi:glycerophosphoryl diester phosphodiesterase
MTVALAGVCRLPAAAGDGGTGGTTPADRPGRLLRDMLDPRGHDVMVVAHRAGWHYAPENSLAGVRACVDMGVDMLEIDVHETRDGRLVLMHDKTLDRTTDGTGPVAAHTLAEVESLHLRDLHGRLTGERVPTLDQVMDLARGHVLVYLDKTEDCIDRIYPQLVRMDATGLAVFYGSRPRPELVARYGGLLGHIVYLPKVFDDTPDLPAYIRGFAAGPAPSSPFVTEFRTDDSPVVRSIPQMRAAARVWASPLLPQMVAGRTDVVALNHPEQAWGWMIARGVTMFCTDEPKALLAYLRARHLHE